MCVCVSIYMCKQFGNFSSAMMPKQSNRTHITPIYQCHTYFYLFTHTCIYALEIGALASAMHKYELFQPRKYLHIYHICMCLQISKRSESFCLPPGRIRNTHLMHAATTKKSHATPTLATRH